MLGFALSPDGDHVTIGYGDPRDGTRVDDSLFGIWRSPAPSFDFERVFDDPVSCLTWTGTGLYTCTDQLTSGFELAVATDPLFAAGDRSAFEPLKTLPDLEGPLDCPAGSRTNQFCGVAYDDVCEFIGGCGADAGVSDAGAGGSPADASVDAAPAEVVASRGGCRLSAGPRPNEAPWVALLLAIAWRRYSRSNSRPSRATVTPMSGA